MIDDFTEKNATKARWSLLIRLTGYAAAAGMVTHAGFMIHNGSESLFAEFFGNLFGGPVGRNDTATKMFFAVLTFVQWVILAALVLGEALALGRRVEIGASSYRKEVALRREHDRLRRKKFEVNAMPPPNTSIKKQCDEKQYADIQSHFAVFGGLIVFISATLVRNFGGIFSIFFALVGGLSICWGLYNARKDKSKSGLNWLKSTLEIS